MADLTYLANADLAGGTDTFYALAKQYFTANGSTVVDAPAQGQTIEGILADLASRGALQETVNIVCRATGLGALAMPLTLADQAAGRGFANAEDVENALSKKSLVPPGQAIVVHIHERPLCMEIDARLPSHRRWSRTWRFPDG